MRTRTPRYSRRAAAAVEMAILLPLLAFLFVIGVDFARVYKHTLTLMNCARSGALYGSNSPTRAVDTAKIQEIALADAGDLSPAPTVTIKQFDLADGTSHLEVTVTSTFKTITNYPGVPSPLTLNRTVQMRITPSAPRDAAP